MPELPEVEIARQQLERWTRGRVVTEVALPEPTTLRRHRSTRTADAVENPERRWAEMRGATSLALERQGKRLGWRFDGAWALELHLGMTGRWVRRGALESRPRFARLGLRFGEDWVWLSDARRFGCVVMHPDGRLSAALGEDLGPDAWTEGLDVADACAVWHGRRAIVARLQEQERLAGVGNIQAQEALYRAEVHPLRPASSLSGEERARVSAGLQATLAHTLAMTMAEEVAYLSDGGDVDNPFLVYKRGGLPCHRCGTPLVTERISSRTTTWCDSCVST
ncbi:MAG: Fpg/Nei family DNA glycosylase [Myxococcota bacterium]